MLTRFSERGAVKLGTLPEVAEVSVVVGEAKELEPNTNSDGHH